MKYSHLLLIGAAWVMSSLAARSQSPPTIHCPTNLVFWTCGTNALVNYGVTATPNCGTAATITCTPTNNSSLPLGSHLVTCTAVNSCNLSNGCTFNVTVRRDTNAPALTCPADRIVQCSTAWTFGTPTAVDDRNGTNVAITVVSTVTNATCGKTFRAVRTWRATDTCGNLSTCSQTVILVDTTPPVILCPSNAITVTATSAVGTPVNFTVTAIDACDPNPVVTCTTVFGPVVSGSIFPPGNTAITCRAVDACGNSNSCTFGVTVELVPKLMAVGSVDGRSIGVCFDAALNRAAAETRANYRLNSGAGGITIICSNAVLRPDGKSVVLTLSNALPAGASFSVTASNIPPVTQAPPQPDMDFPNGTASGQVLGLAHAVIGGIDNPDLFPPFTCDGAFIEVTSINPVPWTSTEDRLRFVFRAISGDFDVTSRIGIDGPDTGPNPFAWRAGLLARAATSSTGKMVVVSSDPIFQAGGNGRVDQAGIRLTDGGPTVPIGTPVPADASNSWLRLARVGEMFTAYRSSDGADWTLIAQANTSSMPFGDTLLVGAAVGSTQSNQTVSAVFNDLTFHPTVCTPLTITNQPHSITNPACATNCATFSVVATGGGPISYQWYFNSAPIPGAVASTYTVCPVTPADAGDYRVHLSNPCSALDSQAVVLTGGSPDTNPPTIVCPTKLTVWTCNSNGAVVFYNSPVASDSSGGPVTVNCSRTNGSFFPLGTNTVVCTAIDDCGNRADCSFTVTVMGGSVPVLACPNDMILEAKTTYGAIATWETVVVDNCDSNVAATCSPPSGTTFPIGTTLVTCSVSGRPTNDITCSFYVTVVEPTVLSIAQGRGIFGTNTVLQWSGDRILQETTSLNPPLSWNDAQTPAVYNGNERALVLSPTQGNRFFQLSWDSSEPLSISKVTPREIDEEDAPLTLTIEGKGFDQSSEVRLYYLDENFLKMDLRPASFGSNSLTVQIRSDWFQALARATNPPSPFNAATSIVADHFAFKVINGNGQATRAAGVRVKRFPARITNVVLPKSGALISGTNNMVDVIVERRTSQGALPVQITAFEATQPYSEDRGLVSWRQVPGIQGAAVLAPGQRTIRVPVSVHPLVPLRQYRLVASLQLRSGDFNFGPGTVLSDVPITSDPQGFPGVGPASTTGLQVDTSSGLITSPYFEIPLRWQKPFAAGFELQRRAPNGTWTVIKTFDFHASPSIVRYVDKGRQPDTEYCYRVRAWNSYGESFSNPEELCASTAPEAVLLGHLPPGDNFPFEIDFITLNSVALRWRYATFADAMEIQRRSSGGTWQVIHTDLSHNLYGWHSYTDSGLPSGTPYCYRIRAINQYGESFSDPSAYKAWIISHGQNQVPDASDEEMCVETARIPPTPTQPMVVAQSSQSISVKVFDHESAKHGLYIYRRDLDDPVNTAYYFFDHTLDINAGWQEFASVFNTTAGHTYCHKFQARLWHVGDNGSEFSNDSEEICATAEDPTDPPAPPDDPPPTSKAELGFASQLWTDPAFPKAGQPFTFNWTTGNFGGHSANAFQDCMVVAEDPSLYWCTGEYSLGTGGFQGWSVQFSGLPAGSYTFVVYLDNWFAVDEGTEANNSTSLGVLVGW